MTVLMRDITPENNNIKMDRSTFNLKSNKQKSYLKDAENGVLALRSIYF